MQACFISCKLIMTKLGKLIGRISQHERKETIKLPFLTRQDAKIYYEVEGEGYPIVFIHGMGLSHINWREQVKHVTAHGFQSICIDVRGHGQSSATNCSYAEHNPLAQCCMDIVHLMNELEIEHAVMIGYSTGTAIAQQLALTYPEKVKGLFLSGAFPVVNNLYLQGKFRMALFLTQLRARRVLAKSVARSNGKDREQIEQFKKIAIKVNRKEAIRLMKASLLFDCRERLKEITVPMLINYGGNETHMMTYRHDYLTYAPTAEVCLFPHVNHATPTKSTEEYNRVLLDFIQSLELPEQPPYFFNPSSINPTPNPMNTSFE